MNQQPCLRMNKTLGQDITAVGVQNYIICGKIHTYVCIMCNFHVSLFNICFFFDKITSPLRKLKTPSVYLKPHPHYENPAPWTVFSGTVTWGRNRFRYRGNFGWIDGCERRFKQVNVWQKVPFHRETLVLVLVYNLLCI